MSCNEPNISENAETEKLTAPLLKDSLETDKVDTIVVLNEKKWDPGKKPVCGSKDVTIWVEDHYEEMPGKNVGIWPLSNFRTPGMVSQLKNHFGFSWIFANRSTTTEELQTFIDSGFTRNKIIAQVKPIDYQSVINRLGELYAYYVDEPIKNDYSIENIIDISNYVINHTNNTKFIIGEYYRNIVVDAMVNYVNYVMYSMYDDWEIYLGIWMSLSGDQRPAWQDMKNRYQTKSKMNWINLLKDYDEFDILLSEINSLNQNDVWLYQLDSAGDTETLMDFCNVAWSAGFLRKFVHKQILEYRCVYPEPCDCDPELPNGWYLYKVWDFPNEKKEVYPSVNLPISP